MTWLGTPADTVKRTLNVDNDLRNMYHLMVYKGNYDCIVTVLNIERTYLKKTLFDQLCRLKKDFRFKNMDIKHGALVSTVFHDGTTVARHQDFNLRVQTLFEQYARDIIDRFRGMLC